ncbi:hypothetical protein [Polyangium jinanense]|uniref:Beta-propeller repeat-containing protein n=1 Tax=Polyangium jinanense TaxID=2829994 RepID=A0A9X3XJ39_9BACT|nr:hypothetical protein [Polyangium jinanense]MDC3961527.1 hypothetical protein [Polyangium jinanense]MDC3989026.1 hypothetical protein [Polyangium jinanense]
MVNHSRLLRAGLTALVCAAPLGCLDPTEAFVEISTNSSCGDLDSTGITAGLLGEIETRPYGTTTSLCQNNGEIGSIVLLPPESEREAPFAFKVVGSLGAPVETACVAPAYGPGCIIARRAMRFVPHNSFRVPVRLSQACAGVLCPEAQTCVDGTCQSATVDPIDCENDDECGPGASVPPAWQKKLGGPGFQMARHLAQGDDGTLVLTGHFDGTLNLGDKDLTSKGGNDVFIASYSQEGQHRWSTSFGGALDEDVTRAAIDAKGAMYVLAQFQQTVDFGGGPLVSAGGHDVAILKLTSWGKLEWSVPFGGALTDVPGAIAVGADGNIYVVGQFNGSAAIGSKTLTAVGESDLFVLSLTPSGSVRWAKSIGGLGHDSGTAAAVDAAGNVYVAGYFEGTVDFGLPMPAMPIKATGSDAFVTSFDADGEVRWMQLVSGAAVDRLHDLAVRGDRVVFAGRGTASTRIGDQVFDASDSTGLVGAFDTGGKLAWANLFGGDGDGTGENVAIAADESIVVSGEISLGSAFGASAPATAPGTDHAFVAILERDGKPRWSKVFSSSDKAFATGVAAPAHGFALVAGWFLGELDVGAEKLKSEGGLDGFLLRVAPP